MPLLMCKGNFVAEPTLWLEYATERAKPTFDAFVKRKQTYLLLCCFTLFICSDGMCLFLEFETGFSIAKNKRSCLSRIVDCSKFS
jgi:hypothetical protein